MMVRRGDRVRLVYTADTYTKLKAGDEGTVRFEDSTGTVHVAWDSGSSLGMVPVEDSFDVIEQKARKLAQKAQGAGDNSNVKDACERAEAHELHMAVSGECSWCGAVK